MPSPGGSDDDSPMSDDPSNPDVVEADAVESDPGEDASDFVFAPDETAEFSDADGGGSPATDELDPPPDGVPIDPWSEPIRWCLKSEHPWAIFGREFAGSVLIVVLIGMLLFAISGVWPPMVAVKSGSMEPNMYRGDLVFVMDRARLVPDAAIAGTGVATYQSSQRTGYERFGDPGDVIVYEKNGGADSPPIIHRARFWVNESENWYGKANRSYVNGGSCAEISACPAPHEGFITKGDDNGQYDQISGISGPVKPGWIKGTAEVRIPWLGHIRLEISN